MASDGGGAGDRRGAVDMGANAVQSYHLGLQRVSPKWVPSVRAALQSVLYGQLEHPCGGVPARQRPRGSAAARQVELRRGRSVLRDLKPQDKLDRRLLPSFAGLLPEAMARHQRAIGTPESYAVAEAQLKRALKLFERGRNDGLRVRAHLMLSDVYDHLGDRGRMEEHHDLGLQLRRKVTGEAP